MVPHHTEPFERTARHEMSTEESSTASLTLAAAPLVARATEGSDDVRMGSLARQIEDAAAAGII
jgi:hypothetical protein